MHPVIAAIVRHAEAPSPHPALAGITTAFSYRAVHVAATAVADEVRAHGARVVALAVDNSPAWAIMDLASLVAPFVCVPLPKFFSTVQQCHVLMDAGVDCLITDRPDHYAQWLADTRIESVRERDLAFCGGVFARFRLAKTTRVTLPAGTAKVTYTSGTTGAPKGVCLAGNALARVAASIATTCALGPADRHASLLPLSTLLENVCGLYANLLSGATCVLAPLAAAGVQGGAGVDADRMLYTLASAGATTTIMTPQMLLAATERVAAGALRPQALRFLAVGGAPLHPAQLARARDLGLPAYEGYGLSECGSVVTLNTPAAERTGSVGRALPHARVAIAEDGEILVSGATMVGYCGTPAKTARPFATGDVGHLDRNGYLHLTGRKRNVFVTSFGRNVSPEWVEAALTAAPAIAQAWVWGEARPWNAAVITAAPGYDARAVSAAVERTNQGLPDYARVRAWIPAAHAFTAANGELTANGRLRRDVLRQHYQQRLDRLYEENHDPVL